MGVLKPRKITSPSIMRKILLQLFFLFYLSASYISVWSQEQQLMLNQEILANHLESGQGINLGNYYQYLADPHKQFSISDVLSDKASLFQLKGRTDNPNLGYSDSSYWIRVDISKKHKLPQHWVIEFPFPTIDHLAVYVVDKQTLKILKNYQSGDLQPFSHRPYLNRSFIFPVELKNSGDWQFIFHIRSKGSLTIASKLWIPESFYRYSQNHYIALSFYFGILAALFLYNALLFVSLRDKIYLLYICFVGTMALAQLAWYGMGFEYLWPDSPRWGNIAALTGFNATGLFGALFSRSFLNLKKYSPKLDKTILFCAISFASLIFIIPLAPYQFIGIMTSIVGALYSTLVIIAGIVCMLKGFYSARYFLLANAILSLGATALGIRNLGLIPTNFFTTYAMLIGSALEMLLLSFALAERINEMKQAKERAEQQANQMRDSIDKIIQQQDQKVENRVHKRTEKLQSLAHTDKLTGLGNRHRLEEHLPLILDNAKQFDFMVGCLFIDLDNFKPINDQHGHALGDQFLQTISAQMKSCVRTDDQLFRLGGDEFIVIIEDVMHPETLKQIAQNLLQSISKSLHINNIALSSGASIGIAITPVDGSEPTELLAAADQAMYQAKKLGKNQVYCAPGYQALLTQSE